MKRRSPEAPFAQISPRHSPGIKSGFGSQLGARGYEDNIRKFELEPEMKIAFILKEDQGDTTINNIAGRAPVVVWENSVT